jgi:predicted helicase
MNKYLQGIKKFDDIYNVTENLSANKKGELFEHITYYLFKLDPRLNNNLQNIWLYKDIPNNVMKELKFPTKDKGIDLLVQINPIITKSLNIPFFV